MNHIDAYEKRSEKLRRYVVSYILWGIAASVALLAGVQYHYANLTASPFDLKVLGQTRLFPEPLPLCAPRSSGSSIDVIDLFYQHRVDPDVPIEEVAGAVKDLIHRQSTALRPL